MADNTIPNAADIAALTQAVQSPIGTAQLNLAQQRGNNVATDNTVLQDKSNLTPFDFAQKYGPEVQAASQQLDLTKPSLDYLQKNAKNYTTGDVLSNIGIGALNSAGGVGILGARLISPQAAMAVGDTVQGDVNYLQGEQSDAQKASRTVDSLASNLDKTDNNAKYASDTAKDGSLIAGLRYLGRDASTAAVRMYENPTSLQEGIAQGVGSVLTAAPTAGMIGTFSKVGANILKGEVASTIPTISTVEGTGLIPKSISEAGHGLVPASVGLQEGGGAYQQTSQQVMQMTPEQLSASPEYQSYINQGYTPDNAKIKVADNAGLAAAAIQGPAAAVTGKLVERFESNPLAHVGLKTAVQDVGKEGLEEGIQNATGQVAQNIGIQQNADPNQSLLEDVGSQTLQGAVFGAASTGAIHGASMVPETTLAAAAVPIKAFQYLKDKGQSVGQQMADAAPNSEQNVTNAVNTAQEQAPAVANGLQTIADQAPENQKEDAQSYIDKIKNAVHLNANDLLQIPKDQLTSMVQDNNGERPNLIHTMASMANLAIDPDSSDADKASAALFIANKIRDNHQLFNEDLPAFLDNVPHDNEHYDAFNTYGQVINAIGTIPSVQEALKQVSKPDLVKPIDITDTNVKSPEVQQTIQNVALQAGLQPQNIDPDMAEKILYQADIGNVSLSDDQKKQIKSAISLQRVNQEAQPTESNNTPTKDAITRQIETEGGNKPWQKSLTQHQQDINNSINSGNTTQINKNFTALQMFAQGMNNKVDALNQSASLPDDIKGINRKVKYQSAGANNQWLSAPNQYTATVYPDKPTSIKNAQNIHRDASMVIQHYNNMTEIYPELGFKKIEAKSLSLDQTRAQSANQEEKTSTIPVEPKVSEKTPIVESKPATKEPINDQTADTIETRYPKLINIGNDKGKNQFHQAYSVPKTEKSRLIRLINPLNNLRDLIAHPLQLIEFMGKDVDYSLDHDNLDALDEILSSGSAIMRTMNERASRILSEKTKKGADSLLDLIDQGKEVNRYKRGRVINIMDRGSNGKPTYNKQLAQSAIIAGINQSLNSDKTKNRNEDTDIATAIGISLDQVNPQLVDEFNRGITVSEFKRSLADNIIEYWGVNKNNNVSLTQTQGIAEAVAAEVMHGLDDAGLISLGSFDYHSGDVNFTQNRVYFDQRDPALVETIDSLGSAGRLLDDAILVEPKKILGINIGKPSGIIADTQMRSPNVKNTTQQREALANEGNTPYYPNVAMHKFMNAFGFENFLNYMGGQLYEDGDLNVNHERSLEGKNRTLAYSWHNVMNQMKDLQQHADKAEKDISEVPTYYDFNMSKVGRMQMQGNNNPQSDKLAREIFMPTKSVLDMTKTDDQNKFWMTVAQGLGVKTEKITRLDAVQQAKDIINNKFSNLMPAIIDHLDNGKLDQSTINGITNAFGSDASMHGLHALLSVAQLLKAQTNGSDLTKYTHFNYLEADGKTNGPIMTTALFASRITSDVIKILRKGGIFLGEQNRSLNDHILTRDGEDLYQSTTTATKFFQDQFKESYQDDQKVMDRLSTVQRVLAALNADISVGEDGELELKRGVTKNPLTISIYGSGIDGIAGKLTSALMDEIYSKMSDLISGSKDLNGLTYDGFTSDLKELLGEQVNLDQKTGDIIFGKPKGSEVGGKDSSPQNFTFSPRQFNALKSHMQVFFVNQMHKGIHDQILQHVEPSTSALQKATNLQSIFLTGLFQQKMIDKLLALKSNPDYHSGDFLSNSDLDQIMKDLKPMSPIVNTGTQNFFIAGSEKSDVIPKVTVKTDTGNVTVNMPDSFSTALDDSLSSPAYVYGPSVAGVKGVPSLVIGTGDGMIMQNASVMRDAPKGTLKVFDGINLPASDIDSSSEKVNQSVYKAMTANPMKAVAESFNSFLANDPIEQIFGGQPIQEVADFVLKEVTKAVTGSGNPKTNLTIDEAREALVSLSQELNNLSLDIEARNIVLSELSMSVDQMASAESPYSKKGSLSSSLDPSEMSDIFNTRHDEVLQNLKDNKNNAPAVEQHSNEMLETLEDTTTPDEGGARIGTIRSLQVWLQNRSKSLLSPEQKEMMATVLTSLKDSGYHILFGSREQLNNYEANNYPEYYSSNDYLGKIIPDIRHAFITNITPETLLHELVHAATLDKVIGYYNGNKNVLSSEDQGAISRIEGLMNEWLAQSTEADSEALNTARMMATNQVVGYIQSNQRALALNEFMAWSLSNQELIKSQKKVSVRNPLFRIIGDTLSAIKSLIWGKRGPSIDSDIYTNLRFNTRILMKTPTPTELLRQDMRKVSIYQSASFGSDPRITQLRNMFTAKLGEFITDPRDPVNEPGRELDASLATVESLKTLHAGVAAAFNMNMQQFSTFQAIHTAMALNTKLNTNALSRVQDIYTHVIDKLAVEDLMKDPLSQNPSDRYIAQEQFNVITGSGAKNDSLGRSDRLNTFLALAMVDDGFRKYLATLSNPKSEKTSNDTLDNILNNIGSYSMDQLSQRMAGDVNDKNVKQALDTLSLVMAQAINEDNLWYEKYTVGSLDKADEYLKDALQKTSEALHNKATEIRNNTNNRAVKVGASLLTLAAAIVNNRTAAHVAAGVVSGINNMPSLPQVAHDFVVEMIGRTEDNKTVIDQVSEGRAAIQQTRQQFIETVPELLGSKFKVPLSDEQKSDIFYGLGKADTASLESTYGIKGTLDLIADPSKRDAEVKDIQAKLRAIDPKRTPKWVDKSYQLANHMINGTYGKNLLRNPIAITHLFGEVGSSKNVNEEAYKHIDNLTSLYALEALSDTQKKSLTSLVQEEPEGMSYLQSYLVGTRKDEQANLSTDLAAINHYKGYIPSTNQEGVSLIVSENGLGTKGYQDTALQQLGYTNIGPYIGSSADVTNVGRSYYYSPVSARATYNQGAMQMVHQTVAGIQPGNGYTVENIAGRVTNPYSVNNITQRIRNQKNTTEDVLPVYDNNGHVTAYERTMDPGKLGLLNKSTDIMKMIGVWNGRQVEEALAKAFNDHLVDNLHDIWINNQTNKNQFVDISKSQDPIHEDAWKIIPQDVKEYIHEKFGNDGLQIRKDMINNAIGYRQASIGDAWTGNTRVSDQTQATVKDIAMGIFGGNNAFRYLVRAERTLQHLVGELKTLIVVKSVVVPLGNAVANVYQLMMRGIPLTQIGKSFAQKTAEIQAYTERRKQEVILQADLRAAEGRKDGVAVRKLNNRITAIQDSYKRMSIWPLIEAGEFSVVSEGGSQDDDIKISNFQDKIVKYIPNDKLKTTYRYAMITKDTPIFKFLAQSVQYADFVAKATMYDHLTQKFNMNKDEAMGAISEEFVNYNLLAGRVRNYSDSVGLTWFFNFKIRSTKIALSMIRNNPARALLSVFSAPTFPIVGHVGTPLDDNLLTAALHGNITNSIGFGPSFRAPTLNPWVNLLK